MATLSAGKLHMLCAIQRLGCIRARPQTQSVHYKISKVMAKRGVFACVCASLQLAHAAGAEKETGRETIVHSHDKF